jgi:hypothetical protein
MNIPSRIEPLESRIAPAFAANIDLVELDGRNGFKLTGTMQEDAGRAVSGAGDVNGDGFADVLIGADSASDNGYYSGAVYVVFGKSEGFPADIVLSALNGRNGFKIIGPGKYDEVGHSVSSAGDMNGDGFDDIIVGSNRTGSYVVFGKAGGFTAELDLGTLNGANGFRISFGGTSVSAAGDVNGDDFDDVIIGGDRTAYVVFGKAAGFSSNLKASDLDGRNGFQISDTAPFPLGSRVVVSGAGDVNGDGFDDLVIGAEGEATSLAAGDRIGLRMWYSAKRLNSRQTSVCRHSTAATASSSRAPHYTVLPSAIP